MITIPTNDFVESVEVRESVVQGICEAFLRQCVWSRFHPYSDGAYRCYENSICRHSKTSKFYGFHPFDGEDYVKFNTNEMKEAFKVLINHGYHIFKVYDYGSWMAYIVRKEPYYEGGIEVFEFNDKVHW